MFLSSPRVFLNTLPDPVEEKELNGWFIYDWANGPYFYSAISFLPLVITSQAKQMAKQHFCGDCTLNEWALDYETKGSCDDSSLLKVNRLGSYLYLPQL